VNIRFNDEAVYVIGAGAQTPVGRSVLAAAAAVRSGISAFAEHPYMFDKDGEPMVVARADWLPARLPIQDRIVALAVGAAQQALRPIALQINTLSSGIATHIALCGDNHIDSVQRAKMIDRFAVETGLAPFVSNIETVAEGHAGGLLALATAVRQLRSGAAELCLIGGADSWLDARQLGAIDIAGYVHSPKNPWGFIPGEGAAFCLITTGAMAARLDVNVFGEVLAVATARETKLMGTKSICTGEGLTAALRGVLDHKLRVSHSYCDLNGETYRADEYGFAVCRTSEFFENAGNFTAAAECWGDVGAASGSLALILPIAGWLRGHANDSVNLAWSSSARFSLRAAALLRNCGFSES
jgi:3-oxoacyl-[acyl-carrier-protein] synthase I